MHALHSRRIRTQRGSALVAAMFGVMLVSMVAMGLAVVIGQDFFSARLMERGTNAFLIADGAMEYAVARVKQDTSMLHVPSGEMVNGTLGPGRYTLSIRAVGSSMFRLETVGTVGGVQRRVISFLYVEDPYEGFRKAMLTNHDMLITGGGNCTGGTHANQNTALSGSCQIWGDVDSSLTTSTSGSGWTIYDGAPRSNQPTLIFPTVDLAHYYAIAQANGQVITGSQNFKGTYSPPGGVLWVDGDVTIQGKTVINGCLIATGTIRQTSGLTVNKYGTHPGMVSREGDILFYGGTSANPVKINGLVYSKSGQVWMHGETPILGNVMGWAGVSCHGKWGPIGLQIQNPEIEEDAVVEVVSWET
jgi:hypothetical protein